MAQAQDIPKARHILYGAELSLYAGKGRSYLRKKRLPFKECSTAHPDFQRVAKAVGRPVQPIAETPEEEILQDTSAIIDFLEARHPEPSVYPVGPCQRLVALLFELYGDEGLMKPAMHYRWNFPEQNDAFLEAEFDRAAGGGAGWATISAIMRGHLIEALGVTPESAPAIETAYEDLLDRLELHFRECPYLLGGRPSIGDFGMIAPLYAHLGRDPHPSNLMKRRAPSC